jgi:hypothetical protein
VFLLSSHPSDEERSRADEAGAAAYLPMSFPSTTWRKNPALPARHFAGAGAGQYADHGHAGSQLPHHAGRLARRHPADAARQQPHPRRQPPHAPAVRHDRDRTAANRPARAVPAHQPDGRPAPTCSPPTSNR